MNFFFFFLHITPKAQAIKAKIIIMATSKLKALAQINNQQNEEAICGMEEDICSSIT